MSPCCPIIVCYICIPCTFSTRTVLFLSKVLFRLSLPRFWRFSCACCLPHSHHSSMSPWHCFFRYSLRAPSQCSPFHAFDPFSSPWAPFLPFQILRISLLAHHYVQAHYSWCSPQISPFQWCVFCLLSHTLLSCFHCGMSVSTALFCL